MNQLLLTLSMVIGLGYAAFDEPRGLDWGQAERGLNDPQVTTIRKFYAYLSRESKNEKQKEAYANLNPDRRFGFTTFDDEIAQTAKNDQIPHGAARKKIIEGITHWKAPRASAEDITRVYRELFKETTLEREILTWDVPIFFTIYTDDEGKIIGWESTGSKLPTD